MKKAFAFLLIIFMTQSVFAGLSCDINKTEFHAEYQKNTYTCDRGQYLPANAIACVPCPTGFTCAGGTFRFNPDLYQGLNPAGTIPNSTMNNVCANNFPKKITAEYTPHSHTCTAGQYLPAGVDACTQCPANSYCLGGTYTFNETTDQGATACDNGYHSSAGSSSASSCEPNIIQITWQGAELADVLANHAETCTYGGDVRTPVKAIHIPGMTFVGWTVAPQQ